MIGNARGHSRTSMFPLYNAITIEALTEVPMGTGQIELRQMQMDLSRKPHDVFGEGRSLSGKTAIFVLQIQVVPFDQHRLQLLKWNQPVNCSSEHQHHPPAFVSFFSHLSIAKKRAGHHLGPSRSASLSRSGMGFKDMMAQKQSGAIGLRSAADQKFHGLVAEPWLGVSHQRLGQGGLRCADKEADHHPVLLGKGNPDPGFSLQRFALRRRSSFLAKLHSPSNSTWETFNSLTTQIERFFSSKVLPGINYAFLELLLTMSV
jgi:hypothetical protein